MTLVIANFRNYCERGGGVTLKGGKTDDLLPMNPEGVEVDVSQGGCTLRPLNPVIAHRRKVFQYTCNSHFMRSLIALLILISALILCCTDVEINQIKTIDGVVNTNGVVILNVFSPNCPYCAYEFKELKKLRNVTVVSLSPLPKDELKRYADEMGIDWYLSNDEELLKKLNIRVVPTTFVICNGKIVKRFDGFVHAFEIEEVLKSCGS
jgi:thiol-disulfide isomerase/thioredoxin